jgi:hypothetical protein
MKTGHEWKDIDTLAETLLSEDALAEYRRDRETMTPPTIPLNTRLSWPHDFFWTVHAVAMKLYFK